jgi:hypothetical protein
MFKPPGQCPVCHEFVPRKAVACPDCGACARSGWNEDEAIYDGLDLPDDDDSFDYDEFTEREFGIRNNRRRTPSKPWWHYVGIVLVLIMVLSLLMQAIR